MIHQTQIKVALSWMDKQRSKTNMHLSSSTENPFLQSLLHEHLMSAIWIQGLISRSCLLCTNPHYASFSTWGANYRFWPSESGSWIKFAISSCVFSCHSATFSLSELHSVFLMILSSFVYGTMTTVCSSSESRKVGFSPLWTSQFISVIHKHLTISHWKLSLVNTEDACSKVPAFRTPTSPRIFTVTSMFDLQK